MNELSIVIPCLYSIENLSAFIDRLSQYLTANPGDINVIIVLNEKAPLPDMISTYVKEHYPWLRLRILQRFGVTQNYGALVRFGIAYSSSKYVVLVSPYGDDDLSIIREMLTRIRKGFQVVQATRYSSAENASRVKSRFRMYQHIYRFLTRLFLGLKISDSTSSFKMFDRAFIQAIGLTNNGYSVCPEVTIKCLLAGGKVDYIASTVQTNDVSSHFRLRREGFGYLLLLMRGFLHRLGISWF